MTDTVGFTSKDLPCRIYTVGFTYKTDAVGFTSKDLHCRILNI